MNSNGTNLTLFIIMLILLIWGGAWWYQTFGPGSIKENPQSPALHLDLGGDSAGNTSGNAN